MDGAGRAVSAFGAGLAPAGVTIAPPSPARAFRAEDHLGTRVFVIGPDADPGWLAEQRGFAAGLAFGDRRVLVVGREPLESLAPAIRGRCISLSDGISERAVFALAAGFAGAGFDADALTGGELADRIGIRFAVRNFPDIDLYGAALAAMFGLSAPISIGLRELLVNAVEHGNLQISGDEKTIFLAGGTYADEIEARFADPVYADRFADLTVARNGHHLIVRIVDCGRGFDWESVIGQGMARGESRHRRGIPLAEAAGFRSFTYVGCGNEIEVEIDLDG